MPTHLERSVMDGIGSWIPNQKADAWSEGPWSRLFKNARRWGRMTAYMADGI